MCIEGRCTTERTVRTKGIEVLKEGRERLIKEVGGLEKIWSLLEERRKRKAGAVAGEYEVSAAPPRLN